MQLMITFATISLAICAMEQDEHRKRVLEAPLVHGGMSGESVKRSRAAGTETHPHPAFLTISITKATSINELLRFHLECKEHFNHIHISACWTSLARLATQGELEKCWLQSNPNLLEPLMVHTVQAIRAGKFGGRELCNVVYGAARSGMGLLYWQDQPTRVFSFFGQLGTAVKSRPKEFLRPQHFANTAWSFATVGLFDMPVFGVLARVAERALRDPNFADAQSIANTAWAFAKAGQFDAPLFDALGTAAERYVDDFNTQELANIAWAFAIADQADDSLCSALAKRAEQHMGKMKSQELGATAWAFAKMASTDAQLLERLARESQRRLSEFIPLDLANIQKNLVTATQAHESLLQAIATANQSDVPDLAASTKAAEQTNVDVRSIPKMVKSCVTSMRFDLPILKTLAKRAQENLHLFDSEDFLGMACDFVHMGFLDRSLFAALARIIENRLDEFSAESLALTAWAFATAGQFDAPLFAALANVAKHRMDMFTQKALGNIAWAFAAANFYSEELFGPRFARSCSKLPRPASSLEQFRNQLHQWIVWHEEIELPPPFSEDKRYRYLSAFRAMAISPSQMQDDVIAHLARLPGARLHEEHITRQGYSIDAATRWERNWVAVEADGPTHFLVRGEGYSPAGATLLKRRQLRATGWRLVAVPFYKWAEIPNSHMKQSYLQRLFMYASGLGSKRKTGRT